MTAPCWPADDSSATSPFGLWQDDMLTAHEAAAALARELMEDLEPRFQALATRRAQRMHELATLMPLLESPLFVNGRCLHWVEPTIITGVDEHALRRLRDDLRTQGLDDLADRLDACFLTRTASGRLVIEARPPARRTP
ncbi:hypothetical protein [Candidatus Chloroploca sp. Khr17]|uniref:hypothetical protein n=1 Tax=Candidatus Chloroploca sp. Khr17 TaxID=2496869 RepID=UPI00101D1B39|nr:hypothetical protein [Candidatus Chloroploca sp. Khr17]